MITTKFNLISPVLDASCNRYKILSLNTIDLELPSIFIEDNLDIDSCLSHIINRHTDGHDMHHNFKLTDVVLSDILEIYYIVFITYETTIKDAHLIDIEPILNKLPNNAKKILSLL